MSIITEVKERFRNILDDNNLLDQKVVIEAQGLSSEEAIGNPERDDFPLVAGEEVMIQAEFMGSCGQAFTDHPCHFKGDLREIMELPFNSNYQCAIFIAAVNAVLRSLDIAEKTIHCRDEEPKQCAGEISAWIQEELLGVERIGIIGYQPAIVAECSQVFGSEKIMLTDLNPDSIGSTKTGIRVWNGKECNEPLVREADLVLATGSSVVNGTIDELLTFFDRYLTEYYFFGNTIAGTAALLDLPRICFYGH